MMNTMLKLRVMMILIPLWIRINHQNSIRMIKIMLKKKIEIQSSWFVLSMRRESRGCLSVVAVAFQSAFHSEIH
jgi:hypothetical protein